MMLGAPIGTDTEAMQALALDAVKGHERFFDLIRYSQMPAQDA